MKNLGTNIKFYRKQLGLTQSGLALQVGLTSNYITLIETGKKTPSIQTLYDIAEKLKVDAKKLIEKDPLFEELSKLANEYGIQKIISSLEEISETNKTTSKT